MSQILNIKRANASTSASIAIGSTVVFSTPKSIFFADASGRLSQDNSNFNWDYANNILNANKFSVQIAYSSIPTGAYAAFKNRIAVVYTSARYFTLDSNQFQVVGADGYLDISSAGKSLILRTQTVNRVSIDSNGFLNILGDDKKITLGASADAGIMYNGTNMIFDSQLVGAGDYVFNSGRIGINLLPTAKLTLPAGESTSGNAPLKFTLGTLLTTPEAGTLEFTNNKLYITNKSKQRVIDRTSDVATTTVTVANTTTETTIWTGAMPANSLIAGNVFKFNADGVVSNNSTSSSDEVTIRIKVNGSTIVSLNPNTRKITNEEWHLKANATQRTLGATGTRASHVHLVIGDPVGSGDEVTHEGTATIDTTASMDVTITAQWASAKTNNTLSLYQGFMEYKN